MKNLARSYGLYLGWIISLVALGGSLYFSNVLNLPPCVLCWYQRICMYPLVLILAVGLLRKDQKVYLYVLPFSIIGFVIALYHNLLFYNIIPESLAPGTAGVSCTTRLIEWFGFITIPLLSLIAFTLITVIMFIYRYYQKQD